MADVYILGIDMTRFGRYPDRTFAQLGGEAALMALDDCGLGARDVQIMYCGTVFGAYEMTGQAIMREIGQTGIPVTNIVNACASGASAFREAWLAVKSGVYNVALAVGVEKTPRGMLGGGAETGIPLEGLFGSASMPAVFAESGTEHAAKYGTTFAQFAKVSVKNHHHSTMNPKSFYQMETPLEQVMGAEMIAYPNTKLMCSVNVDGAAAAVLVSERKARELGLSRAIRVRASALQSDPWNPSNPMMPDVNTVTRLAAKSAYEQAGIGPEDVSLVELHDCFATAELLHYENLGLCGEGQAGEFIDAGETTLGGKVPVNVSGGLLSKGHPLGATGIANMYEVSLHLRGEAGARQVEGAKIGLTHVVGLGTASAVHVLEKA
ncbi:thiolase family protein [Terricaulis silvestris]|uniref:propanoyl-CoA C-acyltransferase n=1 Tax=Terricaulis silvestris TaxID=2686094 RepID=A0A6I6MTS2_9CAUL|nr:thiolase family protein [Terricaulis silvestris]QGZ96177.1 3-ketoacyl-CoA thiolase [Terricaulis silvestris]